MPEANLVLYIDPGTGSMLFTVLIGVIGAAVYSLRMLLIRLRFSLRGGKVESVSRKLPLVIFSDDKRYWNIFAPICRELDRRGLDMLYLTVSPDDPALQAGLPHLKAEHCAGEAKAFTRLNFMKASLLLSTTPGLDVYQWKRSREVDHYAHIFHAANDVTLYRMFGVDYYDSLLLSGAYQAEDIRRLEALRGLPEKELAIVGIPYMDEMLRRLQESGPAPEHPRTILLAPSWGPSAIFQVYGGRILEKLLETGWHVIVRPHPQSFRSEQALMEELMAKYPPSQQLEWNRDTDNFEVLRRSDILISDFSGVVFDFTLVYDKPVIYTDPGIDLSPYDAWWLDKPLWTASALPRLGEELTEENMTDLKGLIERCLSDPHYAEGRRQVKEETWAHVGEGARRCADWIENKCKELKQ